MVFYPFDPWKSSLCTCPRKYSINPYSGCSHACVYCYITSYIPRGHQGRLKKNFFREVNREIPGLNRSLPVTISNSSDPYQPLEREHKITRQLLRKLRDFKVQIVTKGSLVARDADLLSRMRSSVAISLTTLDKTLTTRMEPAAPPPAERLKALERLAEMGIPLVCRVDPIIPYLNEDPEELLEEIAGLGVRHVTTSTFKPRPDSWRRFRRTFPREAEKLEELYFVWGERKQNSYYLPRSFRLKLLRSIARKCRRLGLTFSTCRESLGIDRAPSCDGTHLISGFQEVKEE